MKSKDRKDLHTKTLQELRKQLSDTKKALFDLELDNSQLKLKNTRELFWRKKEIAQILTVLRVKEKTA